MIIDFFYLPPHIMLSYVVQYVWIVRGFAMSRNDTPAKRKTNKQKAINCNKINPPLLPNFQEEFKVPNKNSCLYKFNQEKKKSRFYSSPIYSSHLLPAGSHSALRGQSVLPSAAAVYTFTAPMGLKYLTPRLSRILLFSGSQSQWNP